MTRNTTRDEVWNQALSVAIGGGSFQVKHIRNSILADEGTDRTIRDVLNTMVEMEWLEKESKHGHKWRAGPKIDHMDTCDKCGRVGLNHNLPVSPDGRVCLACF